MKTSNVGEKEAFCQAVILAGGLGTRLRPLTENMPKAMVPVRGVPFIERQLRFLRSHNFRDILLLTGHMSEQIEDHLGSGERLGVRIVYSRETKALGTGGALMHAYDRLQSHFLLLYGDSYLPLSTETLWDKLNAEGALGVIAAYRDNRRLTGVTPNLRIHEESGQILNYQKGGGTGFNFIEAGCSAFKKAALLCMPRNTSFSLESTLFPELISQGSLFSIVTKRRFYDIGTPQGLRRIGASIRVWES